MTPKKSMLDIETLNVNRHIIERKYWRERLQGFNTVSYFNSTQTGGRSYFRKTYFEYNIVGPDTVGRKLNDIAASLKAKHVTLLTVLGVLLQRCSGIEDVAVFMPPYAGEEDAENAGSVVPVRIAHSGNANLVQLLDTVKNDLIADMEHSNYPLERILAVNKDELKDIPIVGLVINGLHDPAAFRDLTPEVVFSFTITDKLVLEIKYKVGVYEHQYMKDIGQLYFKLLERLLDNPEQLLAEIGLLENQHVEEVNNSLKQFDTAFIEERESVPASYHHERLWFIDRFESGYLYEAGPVYHNIPLILNFSGEVSPALLEASVNQLLKRYTVLRTQLLSVEDRVYQQVLSYAPIRLEQAITDGPLEDTQRISTAFTERAFNMDGLLLRGLLLQQPSAERYQLVLVFHHLIADRYSVKHWRDELLNIYEQLASGTEPEETPVAVDYRGFSIWQQERFSLLEFELLPYWRRQLGRGVKALDLPTDRARAAVHIYQSAVKAFRLPEALVKHLRQSADETGFSVELLLLAGFNVLLSKYSRQEEIVVGTVEGNRVDIAGPVSNLIVLRSYVYGDRSFWEYCSALQSVLSDAEEYGQMPFDKLTKELGLEKDMSRTALFDVLFQYEEATPLQKRIGDILVDEQENNLGYGKYDLNLLLQSGKEDINGYLVYNASYFDANTIDTFVSRYLLLLERLLSAPAVSVSLAEMITAEQNLELLSKLDRSNFAYPADQTLVSLFRKQVQLQGRRTAVKDSQEELSYEELDIRSEVLSQELRRRGVQRNSIVGLLIDRQAATVTGMLAILKAGGAYLPVDVEYPADRINWQLQDSGCKVVVTHSSFTDLVPAGLEVVLLDEVYDNAPLNEEDPQPQDLCYVIYTSGTTGRPKGVMVEHRNVVSLLFNEGFEYDFGPDDVWSMFHSHCFDFSVWEIYGALLYGGRVVVLSLEQARDTQVSLSLLRSEGVTVLNQTPSSFYALSEADTTNTLNLRYVIFGGETLNPERLEAWHKRYPQVKLMNMYGITETTVHVTIKEIGDAEIRDKVSNIGVPIATMRICLLDEHMQVVPQGIAGELYVGGAGVSRGYLGREELTAARFVADPYQPGERLYRSGDLARLLPSGELSYLGRIDQQVQLRGYRIELGEIDSRLQEHDSIRECTTRLWETEDDKCLATYYVSDKEIKAGELRSYLSEKLPEYMVPSYFMRLPSLPLTANGKLDRNALPAPEVATEDEYVAPVGPIQEKLVEIWSEVLKIDRSAISTRSNFFELGGHSLRAMIMVNKILEVLGVEVPLKEVFERRDIYNLSTFIENAEQSVNLTIPKAPVKDYYPLSVAQKAIYFFHEFDKETLGYNMPRSARLSGPLDKQKLQNIFKQIVQRHESLRTSFDLINEEPVQIIHDEVDFQIEHYKGTEDDVNTITQQIVRHFDLKKAPLFRVGLIEISDTEHFLVADTDHIIMDGTSWNILIGEFKALYNDEILPEPKLQYRDYVEWQHTDYRKRLVEKQNAFWLDEFANRINKLDLPTDFERPLIKNNDGEDMAFVIDAEQTKKLRQLAEKESSTMFMLMLAVYNILLARIGGQEDIVVGTPIAGREHAHLQSVVGMFVNALPLRNYPKATLTFREFLNEVKGKTLSCFENQTYQYQRLMDELNLERDASRNALYDVMFTYQNFEGTTTSISSLNVTPYESSHAVAEFDLSLTALEIEGSLQLAIGYQTALFKGDTIRRYATWFNSILSAILKDVDVTIGDIEIMTAAEKTKVIEEFNVTDTAFDLTQSLAVLFEEQVKQQGDAPCIVWNDKTLSYNEVNSRANHLANYLIDKCDVSTGEVVAIMFDTTELMLIKILGVLKAGATYLPVDTAFPEQRIAYMLEDAAVKLLMGDMEACSYYNGRILNVKKQWSEIATAADTNPELTDAPETAYLVYTSGSTGKPKGVLQKHATIVNLVKWQSVNNNDQPGKKVAQFASLGFDVSVQEMFYTLLNGYTLYTIPEDVKFSPYDLIRLVEKNQINILFFPTAYLSHFTSMANTLTDLNLQKLERIIVAGDALKVTTDVSSFFERYAHVIFENQYGPTETHVVSSFVIPDESKEVPYFPPIGKPIANTKIYVLDKNRKPVPVGISGEIYVHGPGVAKGYINSPALQADRFIDNPFGDGILYRTGDLARWKEDGNLKYIGRRDDQVKIRGYRVEPEEIEKVMLTHRNVKHAAVVMKENKEGRYLVAYWASADKTLIREMRLYLMDRIPRYMIPDFLIQLDEIPLNRNGKVDVRYLPDPEISRDEDFSEAVSETENRLLSLWSDVLRVDRSTISATRSFFELGGHSLTAITLVNKIQKEFNMKVSLRDLFVKSSVRDVAGYLEERKLSEAVPVEDQNPIQS